MSFVAIALLKEYVGTTYKLIVKIRIIAEYKQNLILI
jgi:hypothetical protein